MFPAGDEGGGGSAPAPQTDALGGNTPPQQEVPAENPAWAGYLEQVPEPVRPLVKGAFGKWDQDVQSRFESINQRYAPYKEFLDKRVDPTELQNAWKVAQMLQSDPQGFTRKLAQHLGLSIAETEALVENQQEQQQQISVDPQLAEMQQALSDLQQYIENDARQRQYQEIQAQQDQALQDEMAAIEQRTGKLSDIVKNEILREALRLSTERGAVVSLEEAYFSLNEFAQHIRSVGNPGANAPQVLAGTNGVPLTPPGKTMGQLSRQETRDAVGAIIARNAAAGN